MQQMIHADTKDARLFAAISSMGFHYKETIAQEKGERVWTFTTGVSDCGKWKLGDLLKWWRDKDFHVADPSHPFHVVKCAMASNRGIFAAIRQGGGIWQRQVGMSRIIEQGGGIEAKSVAGHHVTRASSFAAAASAVGFEVAQEPYASDIIIFRIGDSFGHPFTRDEICRWWGDDGFVAANPQHPFAYAKACMQTYENVVTAIRKADELVKWKPKNTHGHAWINPKCSSETEAQVAQWLKKR